METETVLIGTFVKGSMVPRKAAIREIIDTFNVNQIFIFEVNEDVEEGKKSFLLTFNIIKEDKETKLKSFKEKFKNTLQLHRKKEFNTLYTINSLNAVVVNQNGLQDDDYDVNWAPFKNSCLLSDKENNLKILQTKLYDIIEL